MNSSNNSNNRPSILSAKAIIDKNNEGVEHIINGRYIEAKRAFKTSLVFLALIHHQQKKREEEYLQGEDEEFDGADQFFSSQQRIIIESRAIPDSPDPTSYSHTLYMYRHALSARLSAEEEQGIVSKDVCSCLIALVSFNVSVCAHCKSDRDNNHQSCATSNMRVLKSYRKAWEALQIDVGVAGGRHKSYRDTIVIAVLNNMGALFHQLSNFRKSRYCFRSLKNILSSDSITVKIELAPEIRDGMMMNCYYTEERSDEIDTIL
mmetsp:Transcript_32694/g.48419  ORF Transcript_32694/g.48419 Transcript_32694/m.48419 type:complete len:263 (+) Transcript_32694:220-1008(+)